jgi:hypothetical protein
MTPLHSKNSINSTQNNGGKHTVSQKSTGVFLFRDLTSSTLPPLITDGAEKKCIEVAFTLADFEVWASTAFKTNASNATETMDSVMSMKKRKEGGRRKKEGRERVEVF